MKNLMYIVGAIVGFVLVVYLGVLTRNSLQEYNYIGRDVRDTITINGQGEVDAKPDLTTITLGVVTEGETVEAIQTENTNKMNSIIDAAKNLGIKSDDIKTLNFSVNPVYDWTEGERVESGYEIRQNVQIQVRDEALTPKVLAEAGKLGANQVGGLNFTIDDPSNFEQQARLKAIKDAEEKAQELANELGLTLVRVVSFSEAGGGSPAPMYDMMERSMIANESMMPEPTIETGTQKVTSYVSVTFEVR
ncbi:MAG: SIMPL domain-containing protein [Patescibacteria group bacterium]|nr:SIMPL domain-containing protein [Patescibacteria group bacterium]